jgi:hypothetical protein
MAARMNMLKLLEEVRGLTDFPSKSALPRTSNPLRLQFRGPGARKPNARARHTLRIDMREQIDIPDPVRITFVTRVAG